MADLVKLRIFERNGQFLNLDEEFKLVPENIPLVSDLYPESEDIKAALEEIKDWIDTRGPFQTTITQEMIDNKKVTLPTSNLNPLKVSVGFIGGTIQTMGIDYQLLFESGFAYIEWSGLGLDGFIEESDEIIVYY